jgi:mono/diheme cytochrome c family protein
VRRAALLAAAAVLATAAAGCGGSSGGGGQSTTLGRGGHLFADRCGSCHALSAAGTNGQVGPDLDKLRPSAANVEAAIANGPGVMPAGLLPGAHARAVARWVADHAGR